MAVIAGLTIATWLLATFVTRPESDETLCNFFAKIRPGGPGWKPVAAKMPSVKQDKNLLTSIVGALFASGIVYLVLPAIGFLIFGKTDWAILCLAEFVNATYMWRAGLAGWFPANAHLPPTVIVRQACLVHPSPAFSSFCTMSFG